MRMSKMVDYANRFARFCIRQSLDPIDVAELVTLSNRVYSASERDCCSENGSCRADHWRRKCEEKAKSMGLEVSFPGLCPSFRKDGYDVFLPLE